MVKMRARFDGQCAGCGKAIRAGELIEWNKDTRQAYHERCAAVANVPAPYRLFGGQGYGCSGWSPGQVVRASKQQRKQGYPEFLYVVRAGARYIREDGMSFGVGDESGYVYWAECREATPEEAAPLIEQMRKDQEIAEAKRRIQEIKRHIQENGERPAGTHIPEGEVVLDTQDIYGGGDWFVIGPEWIWYVRNNGMDGDNWKINNVQTGGAGAIGWRIPYDEAIARELKAKALQSK